MYFKKIQVKAGEQKGFTMLSSLIAMGLLGMLTTVAAVGIKNYIFNSKLAQLKGEKNDLRAYVRNFVNCENTISKQLAQCQSPTNEKINLYSSTCNVLDTRDGKSLSKFGNSYGLKAHCKQIGTDLFELKIESARFNPKTNKIAINLKSGKEEKWEPVLLTSLICRSEKYIEIPKYCSGPRNGTCFTSFKVTDYISESTYAGTNINLKANFGNGYNLNNCGVLSNGVTTCSCEAQTGANLVLSGNISNRKTNLFSGGSKWFRWSASYNKNSKIVTMAGGAGGWGDCAGNPCNGCISNIRLKLPEPASCIGPNAPSLGNPN